MNLILHGCARLIYEGSEPAGSTVKNDCTGSRKKLPMIIQTEIANARPALHLFPLPPALSLLRRMVVLA